MSEQTPFRVLFDACCPSGGCTYRCSARTPDAVTRASEDHAAYAHPGARLRWPMQQNELYAKDALRTHE